MNLEPEQQERQLSALFGDLRQSDERDAPSFHRSWQEAMRLSQQRQRSAIPLIASAAAAAIIVAAVGTGLFKLQSGNGAGGERAALQVSSPPVSMPATIPSRPQEPLPAPSIEDWESPTAALLDLSGDEFSPAGSDRGSF